MPINTEYVETLIVAGINSNVDSLLNRIVQTNLAYAEVEYELFRGPTPL